MGFVIIITEAEQQQLIMMTTELMVDKSAGMLDEDITPEFVAKFGRIANRFLKTDADAEISDSVMEDDPSPLMNLYLQIILYLDNYVY